MINQIFEEVLKSKNVSRLASKIFLNNLSKFVDNPNFYIKSSEIKPLEKTDAIYDESTETIEFDNLISEVKKVAIIKLNGGLGTSMGLDSPKSQLVVRDSLNFLEITCHQVLKFREKHKVDIPLIFMNSFNTSVLTEKNLKKLNFSNPNLPTSFIENKSPKISKTVVNNDFILKPAKYSKNPSLEWAPPGHADIYPSLYESGLLDELILKGYEYLFISNIDNLGASFNFNIFEKYLHLDSDFVMEVATRTENDKKGGHLALKDGKLILREVAQVSLDDEADFQDFNKYKYFNTNSIWVKAKSLKNLMDLYNGMLDLPIIINEKNINPIDLNSEKIIQLETAMGSAITLFDNAKTILIPPKRFLPVKNTNNLLYLLSDLVFMNSDFELFPTKNIIIELNSKFYRNVDDFFRRFKIIPSLKNCTSFKVTKDVIFDKREVFEGEVLI